MIKVIVAGTNASVEHYLWSCENKVIEKYLNAVRDPLGPSGADPYPDLSLAEDAVKRLGGEVLEFEEQEYVEGRIY